MDANLHLELWRELPVLFDRQDSLGWRNIYPEAHCQPRVAQVGVEPCLEKFTLARGIRFVVVARVMCLKPTDTCTALSIKIVESALLLVVCDIPRWRGERVKVQVPRQLPALGT